MSYRNGHQPLTGNSYSWLRAGADPVALCPPPVGPVSQDELAILTDAACAHGVLPAFKRNLRYFCDGFGSSSIFPNVNASNCVANMVQKIDRHLIVLAGQSLLLSYYARIISQALAQDGLPACIVKGTVFARRLYPAAEDRSFTDIDILVGKSALQACSKILARLGFAPASETNLESPEQVELKWVLPDNPIVLVEIQTDLIHSRNLGTGIRLCYEDLLAAGAGDPEDATALLLVAAVHGAAGHQFDRLQPIVDVLQAARGAAGHINPERLACVAAATGASFAVQAALDIAAKLFVEKTARQLADTLSTRLWRSVHQVLISPAMVLRSQARDAGRDSWRRQTFRDIIRRRGMRTIRAER